MPTKRTSMRKIRDVLRLHYREQYSKRRIARSLGIAVGTVSRYIIRAKQADLSWPLPEELTDLDLEQRLFAELAPPPRPVPNWEHVKRQLAPKGITLRLVWQKYRGHYPEGYGYSRFCELYHAWRQRTNVRMHIEHKAGEKLYVDYSGKSVPIVDPRTGEVSKAQIFVAVLGYSSYTYVEATQNQKLSNWIGSHRRAFEFFGAAAQAVVPDNLRSAVKKAHRYDPETNLTFQELAEHYDVVILPTRVRKPRDKAKAETGVKIVQSWILGWLQDFTFFSIEEPGLQIATLLVDVNERPFQKRQGSRRSQFEEIDLPAMRPLPLYPYVFREWKKARVNVDYHVAVEKAFYSVPYRYARRQIDVCIADNTVQCFLKGERIASHRRSHHRGFFTTEMSHMPSHHRQGVEQHRLLERAKQIGPATDRLASEIMQRRAHPEQGFRAILGILNLGGKYGTERLEAASHRALELGAYRYHNMASILKNGLERRPLPEAVDAGVVHDNIRGAAYYGEAPQS